MSRDTPSLGMSSGNSFGISAHVIIVGNGLHTLPGLNRFNGSIASFTVFINRTVPAPNSSTKNSLFP